MELRPPRRFVDFHPAEQKGSYIGKKFENLSTINASELRTARSSQERHHMKQSSIVNEFQEFAVIAKSKLAQHRIILGAEIDCADRKSSPPMALLPYLSCLSFSARYGPLEARSLSLS